MKESRLIIILVLLTALTLTVNIYFTIQNKLSIEEVNMAFSQHEKNIEHMTEQLRVHQLTFDSSQPLLSAVFIKNRRFCSLPHEGVALEIDISEKKAYYWNQFTSEARREIAQVYDFEIEKTSIVLSAKEQIPPLRMFQIIEIDKKNQDILGLAGGVDLYPEWCDSINSKN